MEIPNENKELLEEILVTTDKDGRTIPVNEKVSDKEIIDSMDIPFEPIDGRVLVKPLETVILTKEVTEIDEEATKEARIKAKKDAEESGDPLEWPEAVTKTITKEVESELRIGLVLAYGEEEGKVTKPPYEIGDKIVYHNREAVLFELFKDSVLLQRYNIKGKWLA